MYLSLLKKYSVFMMLPFIFSCNPFNPERRTEVAEVYQKSELEDDRIITGENYVFKYAMGVDPIPGAVDDEYSDVVLFSINKNQIENFSFENNNLSQANALLYRSCFCPQPPVADRKVTKGSIKGVKLNSNTWKVDGNFDKIKFSVDFKLKN